MTTFAGGVQMRGGEVFSQRLGAEVFEQGMLQRIVGDPQHGTEAARIMQPELPPGIERDGDVVVLLEGHVGREDAQVSRHAEVNQKRALVRAKEQVLGAAHAGVDEAAFDLVNRVRHRPAQAFVPHDDLAHAPADDVRGDAAQRGFDLGKFRHGGSEILQPVGKGARRSRRHALAAAEQQLPVLDAPAEDAELLRHEMAQRGR